MNGVIKIVMVWEDSIITMDKLVFCLVISVVTFSTAHSQLLPPGASSLSVRQWRWCFVCSGRSPDRECESFPQYVATGRVNCTSRYCTATMKYDRGSFEGEGTLSPSQLEMVSVSRSCDDQSRGNRCVRDSPGGDTFTCFSTCREDYCNGGTRAPTWTDLNRPIRNPRNATQVLVTNNGEFSQRQQPPGLGFSPWGSPSNNRFQRQSIGFRDGVERPQRAFGGQSVVQVRPPIDNRPILPTVGGRVYQPSPYFPHNNPVTSLRGNVNNNDNNNNNNRGRFGQRPRLVPHSQWKLQQQNLHRSQQPSNVGRFSPTPPEKSQFDPLMLEPRDQEVPDSHFPENDVIITVQNVEQRNETISSNDGVNKVEQPTTQPGPSKEEKFNRRNDNYKNKGQRSLSRKGKTSSGAANLGSYYTMWAVALFWCGFERFLV